MKRNVFLAGINAMLMLLFAGATFAQQSSTQLAANHNSMLEKNIRSYYAAFENKDWKSMEGILDDSFTFSSPMDDHISVASYKERCWPNAKSIKKFELQKIVIDGDDAFVTYNGWTNDNRLFRNTEYFRFKNGKIVANECFFGPGVNYPDNTKK